MAEFLEYVGGLVPGGVWVFPGNNPGSPFLAINAPTWGLAITNSRVTNGDLNNDGYTDITMFTSMGGGHLREHVIHGGHWNFGIQQVWDAPTWGSRSAACDSPPDSYTTAQLKTKDAGPVAQARRTGLSAAVAILRS